MNTEVEINTDEQRLRPQGSEVNRLYGDNRRLRELTGWQPAYGGIEGFRRGLAITAEWFSDSANLARYRPGAMPYEHHRDFIGALEAIQQVVGPSSLIGLLPCTSLTSGREAWTYVKDCLDTGWVSTAGQWVSRFEQELSLVTGAAHAVAVTNGTVALRLALVGVKPGDEVLLPPELCGLTMLWRTLRRYPLRGC